MTASNVKEDCDNLILGHKKYIDCLSSVNSFIEKLNNYVEGLDISYDDVSETLYYDEKSVVLFFKVNNKKFQLRTVHIQGILRFELLSEGTWLNDYSSDLFKCVSHSVNDVVSSFFNYLKKAKVSWKGLEKWEKDCKKLEI